MTYDQLVVLESIVETGSFRAAGERLFKSQPAISIAIKKLEGELQFTLFSRDQYRPVLTLEGKAFFEKTKGVLSHFRGLATFGKQLSLGEEPEISVAIESICPIPLMIKILKKFFSHHPSTKLNLSFEYIGGAVEKLLEEKVEIALTPLFEDNPKIESIPLTSISMIPVMAPSFISPSKIKKITLEDMKELVHVVVRGTSQNSPDKSFGLLEGGHRWTVSDHYVKKEIILAGLAWGRLPKNLIQEELAEKKLVPLKIKNLRETKEEVYLVRRLAHPLGPVSKALWSYIEESAKQFRDSKDGRGAAV